MKKCKYCQSEIDAKAKICPNCRKRVKTSAFTWVVTILFVLVIIAAFGSSNNSENDDSNKCYISLEEFNQIKNGMTYEQVKNIVGCEGTVNSDTEYMGTTMTIYSWYGKDGISNANVNIQDGKLINKTQIGLK